MAERDSRRTDAGAVRRGVVLAVAVTVALRAVIYVLALAFNPVLSDFAGGVRIPGGLAPVAAAAVVGAICGWFRLRNSRRYVAATGDTYTGAGRALLIARANASAAGVDHGTAVHAAVQRWSPDLLAGRDPVPDEGLT